MGGNNTLGSTWRMTIRKQCGKACDLQCTYSSTTATSFTQQQHLSPDPPRYPSSSSRLALGMGFSDTVAGLVDRLKPSSKSTSFSGIGSGNQGIVSFEDDVSYLLPTCRQRIRRLSRLVPQLTIPSLR